MERPDFEPVICARVAGERLSPSREAVGGLTPVQGSDPKAGLWGSDPTIRKSQVRRLTRVDQRERETMSDPNELEALKASMRGVRRSAEALAGMSERVEALDGHSDIPDTDLDDLQRLSAAHALAAEALRGLVYTMLKRRGKIAEPAGSGTGGVEE